LILRVSGFLWRDSFREVALSLWGTISPEVFRGVAGDA
jgi:hypothetical protein